MALFKSTIQQGRISESRLTANIVVQKPQEKKCDDT